jgi:hypothetical protein
MLALWRLLGPRPRRGQDIRQVEISVVPVTNTTQSHTSNNEALDTGALDYFFPGLVALSQHQRNTPSCLMTIASWYHPFPSRTGP